VYDDRVAANQELSDHEGGGRAHGSLDGDDGRRPSIPPQVFPDNQQVFVGNLPQYLCDRELHEFFGRTFPFCLDRLFGEFFLSRKTGKFTYLVILSYRY